MADSRHVYLDEVALHFAELEDPRSTVNMQHPLVSVIVIALMAVLAGASGPTAIARWAATKEEFLLKELDLPNGIPRKDVFRRVLMALRPSAFQACFVNWLTSLRATAAEATGVDQPILAVDGKTARRSHDHKNGLSALHSVSVWASEFGLSLGQVACAEKSNEITAIPELLKLVDIKGAIITIDAMGTQKAIAAEIIDGKADYVLGLKGNQGTLHQAVIDHINERLDGDLEQASSLNSRRRVGPSIATYLGFRASAGWRWTNCHDGPLARVIDQFDRGTVDVELTVSPSPDAGAAIGVGPLEERADVLDVRIDGVVVGAGLAAAGRVSGAESEPA